MSLGPPQHPRYVAAAMHTGSDAIAFSPRLLESRPLNDAGLHAAVGGAWPAPESPYVVGGSSETYVPAAARRSHQECTADDSDGSRFTDDEDSWESDDGQDAEGDESAHTRRMPKSGIFSASRRCALFGYCAQYFTVGAIYGGLPATIYGFFLGYLNVPSYVFATVIVMLMLPWSFKFFFGLINDTLPICGRRRKPYMVMGWILCAAMLVVLWRSPLPEPFWCISEGAYQRTAVDATGNTTAATPCNPSASTAGGYYALLMTVAAFGYVVADVAADGLTTEYSKLEPVHQKGATQTTAYFCRTLGSGVVTVFIGVCMNSKLYNGFFDWGLSFNEVCAVLAVPAMLMVPISACLVREPNRGSQAIKRTLCRDYASQCWGLICSKSFFYIVLFNFLSSVMGGISTTADPLVKQYWAGVETMQKQCFSLAGSVLFAAGLVIVKKRLLDCNWRIILLATTTFVATVDALVTAACIFDVFRNQYFYLASVFLTEVPNAAKFSVSTFIIVEMSDEGNEGLVFGLMTTAANLGTPLARGIGNQLYRLFLPSLSNSTNYIEDTAQFRWTVFTSFLLQIGFVVASLFLICLVPSQREEAKARKLTWKRRNIYGILTVLLLLVGFLCSTVLNVLAVLPQTMCMELAGGGGCSTNTTVFGF